MTTIAYRDGVLAADTLLTAGSHRDSTMPKAKKIRDHLVGVAGYAGRIAAFIRWFEAGAQGESPIQGLKDDEKAEALVVSPAGLMTIYDDQGFYDVEAVFWAMGTGREYALGAMEMGAHPAAAVQLASKYDGCTGGSVTVLSL